MKRYYDYEHDQIVHEDELRKEYEEMDNPDNVTFEQYIENCLFYNDGTLLLMHGAETGWLVTVTGYVCNREEMYQVYRHYNDRSNDIENFMDFLDEVVSDGTYRRVI